MTESIIMISGKQKSGKDTLANRLIEKFRSMPMTYVHQLVFADEIYNMHDYCRNRLKDLGIPFQPAYIEKSRRLLVAIGTWAREEFHDGVWIDVTKAEMDRIREMRKHDKGHLIFIISDLRFVDEFHSMPGALTVRLECDRKIRARRPGHPLRNEDHRSEVDLDRYAGHETIWWRKPLVRLGLVKTPENKFHMTFDTHEMGPSEMSWHIMDKFEASKICEVTGISMQGMI